MSTFNILILFAFTFVSIIRAEFKFPSVIVDERIVQDVFAKLVEARAYSGVLGSAKHAVRALFNKDEICSQNLEQMILTCGFLLLNKPLALSLKFQETESIECVAQQFTAKTSDGTEQNAEIHLYTCPFIEDEHVESSEKITYRISSGVDKQSALVYRQNSQTGKTSPIAVIDEMINGAQLLVIRDAGILSEYGKLYVSIVWDESAATEEQRKWSEFALRNRNEEANGAEVFDVCQIESRYQLYLCIQAVEQFYTDWELWLPQYTYQPCKEGLLPGVLTFQCPPIFYFLKKDQSIEVEFKYYLTGSVRKNTAILYYKFGGIDTEMRALALIEEIDLQMLETVAATKKGIQLDNVQGLPN